MKLFCPGPVMISNEIKNAIANTQIGHRSPDFEKMFKEIKNNLLSLSNAPESFDAVILSSSGSSANEAVIASLFTNEDKVLILSNGAFGERIEAMVKSYNINYDIIKNDWGQVFDLTVIEKQLQTNSYNYLFVSHDETSSGLLNPIEEIGALCKKYETKLFVDCVSSFGSDEVDITKQNISIMTGVSGKAIGAIPGASFIIMEKSLFEKCSEDKPFFYLNLANYYKFSKINQTPNTPNITSFIALDVALKSLKIKSNKERYLTCSNYLRDQFEKLGIEFVVKRELMSNSVTTIVIKDISAKDVYDKLYKLGYTTYLTKGIYEKQNCLQVCVMGEIYLDDCKQFITDFKTIVKE